MTTALKSNVELKAYGTADLLAKVLTTIQQNQEEFLPCQLDGFQFYRGMDILRVQRVDDKNKPAGEGRIGFVELNDLRLWQLQVDRLERILGSIKSTSPLSRLPNWNLMGL
jgi:hypothetical protein